MDVQPEPVLDPSSLSLAVLTAVATYLGYKCFKAPRYTTGKGTKTSTSDPDSLNRFGLIWIMHVFRFFVIFSGVVRCIFTLVPSLRSSAICPNPSNLDPRLLVWSWYNAVGILLTSIGGCIRLASYHQLGRNFTFELDKPDRLVVDGIYQYIQHPGYTGGWTCAIGILMFFVRFEGGLGCYVPATLLTLFSTVNLAVIALVGIPIVGVRVSEEEKMLKRAFGEEWTRYHCRTKRFLPGMF